MGHQPLLSGARLRRLRESYAAYIANPDPLMEAGNLLAFVIGTNQPFYPIYLAFIAGTGAWRALPLMASMPFFLAVPILARRSKLAARILLVAASIANVVAAIALMGDRSGLAMLFIPCAAIAAILFRDREKLWIIGMVAMSMAAWLFTSGMGPNAFSPDQYASMQRLNAMSAIGLCGVIGLALAGAVARIERSRAL